MASNQNLKSAIDDSGISIYDLAAAVGVDPKTVQRWVYEGRVPYKRHRSLAARTLGCDSASLWPSIGRKSAASIVPESLVEMFPHRTSVPIDLWRRILDARSQIDILVYAGGFLYEQLPGYVLGLCELGRNGVRVRVLLGEPTGDAVRQRGDDEQISGPVAGRASHAFKVYSNPNSHATECGLTCFEIRLHDTVLYNSIYRFDDEMIVNTHVYGLVAANAPTLHLRSCDADNIFRLYAESYEKVWAAAVRSEEQ